MTHEYDDPVTKERVEAAVQLVARLQSDRHAAPLDELAIEAVDTVFCTCITSARMPASRVCLLLMRVS
jgi:hypothetical protein